MAVHELKVMAEHADQVFLQAHHQGVDPTVEDDVGPLPTHLRGVAGRHVLHMKRGTNHRAGDPKTLGAVALHLGPQHQLRCRLGHGRFHREVVIGDQGFEPQLSRQRPDLPGHLAAVGAQPDHFETQLATGDPGGRNGMGAIGKDEHPFPGQIGGIDGTGIPGQAGLALGRAEAIGAGREFSWQLEAQDAMQLPQEVHRGTDADRNGLDRR